LELDPFLLGNSSNILKNSALYPRHHEWNPEKLWLDNAMAGHDKRPFCAIISQDNPQAFAAVMCRADLDELEEPRWQIERQRRIRRIAIDMAACAESLLRNARVILFVDPHLIPNAPRFKRPLQAFLQIVARRPASIPVERIEIHTGHKSVEPKERFYELRSIIPRGMKIQLVRWDQSYLHDRFILTNACGLEFSAGLDENSRTYAHVTLLEPGLYSATWEDYQRGSSRIPCIEDDLVIEGIA
jgi:hypothetical protein